MFLVAGDANDFLGLSISSIVCRGTVVLIFSLVFGGPPDRTLVFEAFLIELLFAVAKEKPLAFFDAEMGGFYSDKARLDLA